MDKLVLITGANYVHLQFTNFKGGVSYSGLAKISFNKCPIYFILFILCLQTDSVTIDRYLEKTWK